MENKLHEHIANGLTVGFVIIFFMTAYYYAMRLFIDNIIFFLFLFYTILALNYMFISLMTVEGCE